ncbi:uncharacterized protein [Oryza sativa Japonica Group]|uniref:uncharacterized protein isoform X1 n=2 Tax=Oryza sativa subsp. japonica TaxID=39947 RepID=UPI000775442B|nr:uncharacterized protein LOC4344953 isoform X2 [Oryza sativa Japonica Group]
MQLKRERKIMARERGNENTTYLNEYERGRAERIKKNNIALQAIIQKRRELAKSSEGNLGSASTHQETRKRKRVDCAGSEPARHESGLPNLSRSTRRGTGSSTSTHDEDEELVANTNHLFMHDCERNDELAENGGKRMANGGGNENTTYVNEYERLRAERIKKNNIALQAVIEKKKELANLSEENLGSASTHQETRKRKKALEDAVEEHPEWTEKSITEGDLMSRVCGPERNGFVRSVGKGPTPRDLEMPGKEKYRSTKVQMAIEGQKQAQLEKEALIEHFERRQTQSDRKIESLSEKVERLTELLLADSRDGRQVHVNPQVLSNSATNEDEQESANGEAQPSDEENNSYGMIPPRPAAPSPQEHMAGKEVILYSFIRPP